MITSSPKDPAAAALGRRGGRKTSAAKARASRANGRRGGRPTGPRPPAPAKV